MAKQTNTSMRRTPAFHEWRSLLERALAEDIGSGDITSKLTIPETLQGQAVIEAREDLIVCGIEIAQEVFAAVEPTLRFEICLCDGERAPSGAILARVTGSMRGILAAERTALNFMQRLSGIATLTQKYVQQIAGTSAKLVDTRKTLPGWRVLDKYAVATGGGTNHRIGLYDGILIKDNHIAAAGSLTHAVRTAKSGAPKHLRVQVEVESLTQAKAALEAGADSLLLDNQTPQSLKEICTALRDQIELEASGGVTLANIRTIAETGVHRISVGALTHSAVAVDIALEIALDSRPA